MRGSLFIAAAIVGLPTLARADGTDLEIFGDHGGDWDAIVREIQASPETEGRIYALGVRSHGHVFACGEYSLSIDPASAPAFQVVPCIRSTRMTLLRVVSRAPLFTAGDVVPEPRHTSIRATITAEAGAEGGGERPSGGSRVSCSVRLEPYLWDSLHGLPVPLTWERFEVRPLSEDIHASADGGGWIARGESGMSVRFRYYVVDRKTGKTVLENEATLECADRPVAPPAEVVRSTAPVAIEPLAADPPPDVPLTSKSHSLAALKLGFADLALLRDDDPHFRGAFVLAPYSTIGDFAGGLQLGITNTTGEHPWDDLSVSRKKNGAVDVPRSEPTTFRGFAQIGVIDATGGSFHGFTQLGLLTATSGSFRGGFQLGVLGAGVGGDSALALQLGGLFAVAKDISGVQIGGLLSWAESVDGIQLGAGAMASGTVRGLQLSAGNMVFDGKEHHASMTGAQIAEWNFASSLTGLQIGAVNIALRARGLQIGAVNYARSLSGVQIGAINIISNGPVPFLPGINAAFDG